MATITFRLDDRVRGELEQLAATRGVSLSDLVRSTVEQLALPEDVRERPTGTPVSISAVDRQQLALLHRILAHVMPAEHDEAPSEDCARVEGDPMYQRERAQILEGGYVTEYGDVFVSTQPELSASDCRFVLDVLDLFQQTDWAMTILRESGQDIGPRLEHAVTFRGFDGADDYEARLLDYARHRVTPDRWATLLPYFSPAHDFGNSHGSVVDTYRRMVDEYRRIIQERRSLGPERYQLNLADLERLAGARSGNGRG